MTTNVPTIEWLDTGLVLPTDDALLAGAIADIVAAFAANGQTLNPALNTPQGQLASSWSAMISACNALFASYVNKVDPRYSSGTMQDAIGYLYFLTRNPAEPTVLQVSCVGLQGVTIPVGALISDGQGNTYSCTGAVTIPAGGSITAQFENLVTGPIAVPSGALSIAQAIPGWDTATLLSGVVGQNVESPTEFEYRRKQSVAINAKGTLPAIYANVFAVAGVLDVYAAENTTSSNVTIGGQVLVPHSIYVAVVGGADADVAAAIWQRKDAGADYNGNTSVTVTDTSGYAYPQPSYAVRFERPASLPILFAVQLANNSALPANITTLVQAAIMAAFVGSDGGSRARIGSTIFASRFYAGVAAIDSSVEIISILIGTSTPTLPSVTVPINEVPTVVAGNITVTLV